MRNSFIINKLTHKPRRPTMLTDIDLRHRGGRFPGVARDASPVQPCTAHPRVTPSGEPVGTTRSREPKGASNSAESCKPRHQGLKVATAMSKLQVSESVACASRLPADSGGPG